jgi:hypothetical protein
VPVGGQPNLKRAFFVARLKVRLPFLVGRGTSIYPSSSYLARFERIIPSTSCPVQLYASRFAHFRASFCAKLSSSRSLAQKYPP